MLLSLLDPGLVHGQDLDRRQADTQLSRCSTAQETQAPVPMDRRNETSSDSSRIAAQMQVRIGRLERLPSALWPYRSLRRSENRRGACRGVEIRQALLLGEDGELGTAGSTTYGTCLCPRPFEFLFVMSDTTGQGGQSGQTARREVAERAEFQETRRGLTWGESMVANSLRVAVGFWILARRWDAPWCSSNKASRLTRGTSDS